MATREKILEVTLENDNVIKTVKEVYEDRYEGREEYSQCACECIVDDFKEQNKVWTMKHSREGFDCLNTKEDWEPEGNSVVEDIESFQKYLDETYGKDKYEAYALGAYVHGSVSFAFNKGEDTRCRWDSGTCGFVGINKEVYDGVDLNSLSSQLSDAWNGSVEVLSIYDNYEEDWVDEIYSTEPMSVINDWKERMKAEYGVTEYKQTNN